MSASPRKKPATGMRSAVALMRKFALALPEAHEAPHFDAASFRVRGKIFATYGEQGDRAVLKFPAELQAAMIAAYPNLFQAVDGFWGRSGWTRLDIAKAPKAVLQGALASAWVAVAPKKLVAAYAPKLRKA